MNEALRADVVVIGGGVSGLAAAYWLQQKGRDVLVVEKDGHWGGAMQSRRENGVLIEAGPNSALETTPLLTELIQETGAEDKKQYADPASNKRYILRNGKLLPLPMSPPAFVATKLFSLGAKLRLFKEPFLPPSPPDTEESVADFVRRRLGNEFLDYAINPFVAGVYAGDPELLNVKAAFPRLHELEQKYGSLIKGQIKGAKERKRRGEAPKQSAKMFSFAEGMQTLPVAVASKLKRAMLSTEVSSLTHNAGNAFPIAITAKGPDGVVTIEAKTAILAAQASGAARIIGGQFPDARNALLEIPYPPVAVIISTFRRSEGMHPLDGFGFLIPKVENREILGTIFTSALFPERAPEDLIVLTSFIGGMRQPGLAQQSKDAVIQTALDEQHRLLGTPREPVSVHATQWERAIPQYTHGHLQRMAVVEDAETHHPGLFFCANYRSGISVGDCIKSAHAMAERVDGYLRER